MASFSVISDYLDQRIEEKKGSSWVSFEFFPPKTEGGVDSLFKVLDVLKAYDPLFADVTWGAGGSTSDLTLDLCRRIKEQGVCANLHLTCTNMEKSMIDVALQGCSEAGIKNILALRGDPPLGQERWSAADAEFTCALDLVRYIVQSYPATESRKTLGYQSNFSIAVAGYPEGHPSTMVAVNEEDLTPTERMRYSIDVDENGNQVILVCRDADYEKELTCLKVKLMRGRR